MVLTRRAYVCELGKRPDLGDSSSLRGAVAVTIGGHRISHTAPHAHALGGIASELGDDVPVGGEGQDDLAVSEDLHGNGGGTPWAILVTSSVAMPSNSLALMAC